MTYRYYIIEKIGDVYTITGWSRSLGAANKRAGDWKTGSKVAYAASRKQAATQARKLWGIDVDWKKFEVKAK